MPGTSLRLWLLAMATGITAVACCSIPHLVPLEPANVWNAPPCWENFLWFGAYQGENLLCVVARAARLSLYISTVALLGSIVGGIALIFLDFHAASRRFVHRLLRAAVYFPRLFMLILCSALLGLYQPSRLATAWGFVGLGGEMLVECWLMAMLGITGAFFLAAQTSLEVDVLRQQLFVHFATSLRLPAWRIFFHHVVRNCTLLPIAIAKQMRDNIVFLATLSFIGLVHLQPEELGGLVCKYYNSPEAFYVGWWILFFPCAALAWLVVLFDQLATSLSKRLHTTYTRDA